jgi:dephospho-CoA kinase
MKVIGITGGVGAGKSTVLNLLIQHYNAFIIMADNVAKNVMEVGEKGYLNTIELFGEDILCADGTLDRNKLAHIIFSDPKKRMVINSVIHPLVKNKILEEINRLRIEGKYDYVFIEAALLIEDHYDTICDEFWYIYVPEDIRRKRLSISRGYSDEKINNIFKSQLTEEEYRAACKQVIDNSSSVEDTLTQLVKILQM